MPPRTRSCGPMRSWWSFRHWGRRRGRGRARRRPRRPTRRRPPMPELHHTIVAPVVTEKSSAAYGARKEYAFRVHPEATKPQIRRIDFRRDKFGVPAKVASVEYDPNRTARIALLHYADGEKRYILAPKGLTVGDTVVSGPGADIRIGNAMPLFEIPLGTTVH